MVYNIDANGALVDISAKSAAYLPVREACIHDIRHVEEAGIFPGLQEEFVIIDENEYDDSLILSLRSLQYDLSWERCRQLQAEDVVVKGKVSILLGKILFIFSFSFVSLQYNSIMNAPSNKLRSERNDTECNEYHPDASINSSVSF